MKLGSIHSAWYISQHHDRPHYPCCLAAATEINSPYGLKSECRTYNEILFVASFSDYESTLHQVQQGPNCLLVVGAGANTVCWEGEPLRT